MSATDTDAGRSTSGRPAVVPRMAVAAAAATGTALAAAAVTALFSSAVPCRAEGWGCLGRFLAVGLLGLAAAAAAQWPLLHRFGVRPAFPTAVLGLAATATIVWAATRSPWPVSATALGLSACPLGYALAAYVTHRASPRPARLAVIAVVAVLPVTAGWVDVRRDTAANTRPFTELGIPLLVPEVPGHHIVDASADQAAKTLRYGLRRDSLPSGASDYERATATLSVTVRPVPAGFAPPKRCNWDASYRPDQPCEPAAPNVWRRAPDDRSREYLAVHGTTLVLIAQTADAPDDALLRHAATTVRPHPAKSFF